MYKSFTLIIWICFLAGLAGLGIYYLLKSKLKVNFTIMEAFVITIPLAVGYLAYFYLILASFGILVMSTAIIIAIIPLITFISLPSMRNRIFYEKMNLKNAQFNVWTNLKSRLLNKEIQKLLGLALIITGLTLVVQIGKIYHYVMNKPEFYWFDPWRYWQLGRRIAASGSLAEQYIFGFYSSAIECFLAVAYLPINTTQATIDVTKFIGIAMFFLETIGVFTLVQIYLKPHTSRVSRYMAGLIALSMYISAPIVVYHSLIIVHETSGIPLLFSLLILSAKVKKFRNRTHLGLLVIYLCLFWTTSVLMLIVVLITLTILGMFLLINRLKTRIFSANSRIKSGKIKKSLEGWRTWLIVTFFIIYPMLSILNSIDNIVHDIEIFFKESGFSQGNFISGNGILGIIELRHLANILANSTGLLGTGFIIFLGIILPHYWKYLKFNSSSRFTIRFLYGTYIIGFILGLFWNIMPLQLFMGQFRYSLYMALSGSIIVGISAGCFLQFTNDRIKETWNKISFQSSLVKHARKIVALILLIQLIYGISLSNHVYMWEDDRAYNDLLLISTDLPVEFGSIYCVEPNLLHMLEGVLFPGFEVVDGSDLSWKNLPVKPYTPNELIRYIQLLKKNNVNHFIIYKVTWNTTRQIYEQTRLEVLMTALGFNRNSTQTELWTKSWDQIWEEQPNFQKLVYTQLLVVNI